MSQISARRPVLDVIIRFTITGAPVGRYSPTFRLNAFCWLTSLFAFGSLVLVWCYVRDILQPDLSSDGGAKAHRRARFSLQSASEAHKRPLRN
jgi:hypothetical protein